MPYIRYEKWIACRDGPPHNCTLSGHLCHFSLVEIGKQSTMHTTVILSSSMIALLCTIKGLNLFFSLEFFLYKNKDLLTKRILVVSFPI